MRASTMGILAVAILVGLGATAAAKYAGVFDSTTPPVVKEEPIRVLVAKNNMFPGVTITANDVAISTLNLANPQVRKDYEANKDKHVPLMVQWANFRTPARSINANQALLLDDFEELEMAKSVPERIGPGMRAVQLSLTKERAAGGLLRTNDYVDVMLTTTLTLPLPKGEQEVTRTAVICRDAKIIVKRNSLWTMMKSDPDNKLVSFALEVNPYRAALIEYAKERGTLSLLPSSGSTIRAVVAAGVKQKHSDPNSREYVDEDTRVASIDRGELTVGDTDLMRIFNLKMRIVPPPPPPHRIEMYSGIKAVGLREFANQPEGVLETSQPAMAGAEGGTQPIGTPKFIKPAKDCPTCPKTGK